MMDWPNEISNVFPYFIGLLAIINALIWLRLFIDSRYRKAELADYLVNAVRTLPRQSDITSSMPIDERINVFLADIRDAVDGPSSKEVGPALLDRLMTKDESRIYLRTHRFERWYSVARTAIEVFPLLGIIGTVIAIWAGMNASGANDAEKVTRVVQNFGHSVISTAVGLAAAIAFMTANSWFEPEFERLLRFADEISDMVAHAKKKLGFAVAESAGVPQ